MQFYSSWKESIEKKRNKEGGKSDISDEFAALKNRLQRKVASFSKNLKREKEKNPLTFFDDANLVSLAHAVSDSPPTHPEARSIVKRTVGKPPRASYPAPQRMPSGYPPSCSRKCRPSSHSSARV